MFYVWSNASVVYYPYGSSSKLAQVLFWLEDPLGLFPLNLYRPQAPLLDFLAGIVGAVG
jgi:hypothetical protein